MIYGLETDFQELYRPLPFKLKYMQHMDSAASRPPYAMYTQYRSNRLNGDC